jgi:ribosomal protein S12 methylthiotransferase accessory factor YcaO
MYCPQCDNLKFSAAMIAGALVSSTGHNNEEIAARSVALAQALQARLEAVHTAEHPATPEYQQLPDLPPTSRPATPAGAGAVGVATPAGKPPSREETTHTDG